MTLDPENLAAAVPAPVRKTRKRRKRPKARKPRAKSAAAGTGEVPPQLVGAGGGGFGPGRLKVDSLLSEEDREAYLAHLRDPRCTVKSSQRWLTEHGYVIGNAAFHRHRRKFQQEMKDLKVAGQMALAFAEAAREAGSDVLAEASVLRCEQLLMQQLFRMKQGDDLTGKQWQDLNRAIGMGLTNRRAMDAIRQEFDQTKRRAASEGQKAARSGADGQAVVDRVREILGIPPGDETVDAPADVPLLPSPPPEPTLAPSSDDPDPLSTCGQAEASEPSHLPGQPAPGY